MPSRPDGPEVPPTAGLPLRWTDLRPLRAPDLSRALTGFTGQEDAIVTCSGTAALIVALSTLARDSRRREVVVPAFNCPLVAHAVAHCGLELRLCDSRPGHFEMDPDRLADRVGPDTLAVIPAHLGGRLADTAACIRIAHAAGAHVIEDAAQALGARHVDGRPAASHGDIGFYSLAVGKGLSIYEGGLLVASEPALIQALRQRAHELLGPKLRWELRRNLELLGYWALYRPTGLGLAYGRPLRRALRRGDPVGAVGDRFPPPIPLHQVGRWRRAVGTRAAARLEGFLRQIREQARRRRPQLADLPGVQVLDDRGDENGTWPFFMLLLPSEAMRDACLRELWTAGLGVSRLFIHALPDYPELRTFVPQASVPHACDFAARSLTISNSLWLDDTRFHHIVATLRRVLASG